LSEQLDIPTVRSSTRRSLPVGFRAPSCVRHRSPARAGTATPSGALDGIQLRRDDGAIAARRRRARLSRVAEGGVRSPSAWPRPSSTSSAGHPEQAGRTRARQRSLPEEGMAHSRARGRAPPAAARCAARRLVPPPRVGGDRAALVSSRSPASRAAGVHGASATASRSPASLSAASRSCRGHRRRARSRTSAVGRAGGEQPLAPARSSASRRRPCYRLGAGAGRRSCPWASVWLPGGGRVPPVVRVDGAAYKGPRRYAPRSTSAKDAPKLAGARRRRPAQGAGGRRRGAGRPCSRPKRQAGYAGPVPTGGPPEVAPWTRVTRRAAAYLAGRSPALPTQEVT
jgi:hypothetical protein